MRPHQVKIHRHPAKGSHKGALLFVHGAYSNSTHWEYNFIPFFQKHGYHCSALDLSGHGASEGHDRLDEFGIDDYAEDVAYALKEIGQPAIVVGHSMGALVLQRYLEKGEALAAIFLAPVPTTGTSGSAAQLALRFPSFYQALEDTVNGKFSDEANDLMAKIYFSPTTTGREIQHFLPTVGRESDRAVTERALLPGRPHARRQKVPALVIGGTEDAVFPSSMLFFNALPWQADVLRVPGAGHMLPLDIHWKTVASHMLDWINAKEAIKAA